MNLTAEKIVERFGLSPHPEGGFFREIHRDHLQVHHPGLDQDANRAASTAIYFLVAEGDFSAFHRVTRSDEMWHLYAGGPLELHLIHDDGRYELKALTTDLAEGEPTCLVHAGVWQAARPAPGVAWAFCGATVAPGFDFADFEMPAQQELLARFPDHAGIVRQLSRSK